MELPLTPDSEKLLNELVAGGGYASEGEAVSAALRMLHERTAGRRSNVSLTKEEKLELLNNSIDSLPKSNARDVDTSRESIYEGRGE
ncbi:hypothetical protein Mal64_23190 [Pseudobythopirellula maris]|uniref:Type II toxin-antitoxin system ParD family antitoxin n=1 Tax=Pseudobythopirellula maris TaxID=2527991 RepID=A0A5C5ZPV4_9BACT|nr:hypothetical protein [Pseudobythopirellula maris]TWT88831.1 hypothetical protein Mal64_23190 [Pseudobythopirellula maris]